MKKLLVTLAPSLCVLAAITSTVAIAVEPHANWEIYVCAVKQVNPERWTKESDVFVGSARVVSIALSPPDARVSADGARQLARDAFLVVDQANVLRAPAVDVVLGEKAATFYTNSDRTSGMVMVVARNDKDGKFTGVVTDPNLAKNHELEYLFTGPCLHFANKNAYDAFLIERSYPDFFGGNL